MDEKKQEDLGNPNSFTVDSSSYTIALSKANDKQKKGDLIRNINEAIVRNGTVSEDGIFITSDFETYSKIVCLVDAYEKLCLESASRKIKGVYHDFFVKSNDSNLRFGKNEVGEVESTLYETMNNIGCAERRIRSITGADLVRIEKPPRSVRRYIVYIVVVEN